jgi:hypothetical protein
MNNHRFRFHCIAQITLILCIVFFKFSMSISYGQITYVPYRVGDKFGISDIKGNLVLPATYNNIQPLYGTRDYFEGYKILPSAKRNISFIRGNKVLIKDKYFQKFSLSKRFIVGIYPVPDAYKKTYDQNVIIPNRLELFTLEGKPIFQDSTQFISFLETNRSTFDEQIFLLKDKGNKQQLVSFNANTYQIENVWMAQIQIESYKIIHNSRNKILELEYLTAKKERRIAGFSVGDTQVNRLFDSLMKTSEPIDENNREGNYRSAIDSDPVGLGGAPIDMGNAQRPIDTATFVCYGVQKSFIDNLPEQSLYFRNGKPSYPYSLKRTATTVGLTYGKTDSLVLPNIYDEIYYLRDNAFILKSEHRYGLYIFFARKPILIAPIFDLIPSTTTMYYSEEDGYIVALYDRNLKFWCYANQNGQLYYKP